MTEYTVYTTKPNDRLDKIAALFGDCFNIQPIYDANPHLKADAVLPEGMTLLIPLTESTKKTESKLPIWKRTQ